MGVVFNLTNLASLAARQAAGEAGETGPALLSTVLRFPRPFKATKYGLPVREHLK